MRHEAKLRKPVAFLTDADDRPLVKELLCRKNRMLRGFSAVDDPTCSRGALHRRPR